MGVPKTGVTFRVGSLPPLLRLDQVLAFKSIWKPSPHHIVQPSLYVQLGPKYNPASLEDASS